MVWNQVTIILFQLSKSLSQIGSAIIGEKGGENNGANIKTNPWKDE
jgi:hypothetical protein